MPASVKPKSHMRCHKEEGVWAKGQTLDDIPTGYWEWFKLDGKRMRSGTFEDGKPTGQWMTYDKTGQVYKVTAIKTDKA